MTKNKYEEFWFKMLGKAQHRWITISIQNTDYEKKQARKKRNLEVQAFIQDRLEAAKVETVKNT